MEFIIPETAVAEVDGIRVAASSLWDEEYTLDGQTVTGPRATLVVMGTTPETDFDVRVHVGQEITIGARRLEVLSIHAPDGKVGTVTLRSLDGS